MQCEVWSVKEAVGSEKCEVWSVKCEVWSVKFKFGVRRAQCEVWSVKCEVWSVKEAVRSEKCGVWSVKCGVWSLKFGVRRVQCAVWGVECRGKDTVGTGCLWTIGHLCLGNFRRRLARVYVNRNRCPETNARVIWKKHQMIFGQAIHFQNLNFQNLKDVSHESFVFTFSTVTFLGTSRTKASFSDLPLSLFEGGLAPKLRFHIFSFQFLREVSHESFVFTSSAFRLWGRSRTKAEFHIFSFQTLREVSHESFVFTSSAFRLWGRSRTKAEFHIFSFQTLREVSHESFVFTSSTFTFRGTSRTKASFSHLQLSVFEGSVARNPFLRDSRCTKCSVLQYKTCLGRWMGKLVRRTVSRRFRLCSDHGRIGHALELRVQASFCRHSCA